MPLVEIQHNIDPSRVLFCYRSNDPESLEVAQYYAQMRQLENYQLCALPVDAVNEVDYETYYNNIELPILACLGRMTTGGTAGVDHIVHHVGVVAWALILGFNIPHLIDYYGEKISVASRLHRLGHPVELKRPNSTFDRKSSSQSSYWRFFDDRDHEELYITAVIDGPTKQDAINLIQRSITVDNQGHVSGKIVLDPYGKKTTEEQLDYQAAILDFIDHYVPYLGSQYTTTVDIDDPYQDPTIQYLEDDSFYWGWYVNTVSPQMFKDSRTMRTFLYNADSDAASDIKEVPIEGGRWCNSAIVASNPGYAATAGAIDGEQHEDPYLPSGEDAYLLPRPFFEALHRGAGIGEAFLYASRFVDWKLMLIGDPLMVVKFPLVFHESAFRINNDEVIYKTIRAIESYLKKMARLSRLVDDIINFFLDSPSFQKRFLFFENVKWRDGIAKLDVSRNYIGGLMQRLVRYHQMTTRRTLSQWLTDLSAQVSSDFAEVLAKFTSESITSDLIYQDGRWEVEFAYTHPKLTLEDVNFVIEVSRNSTFDPVVATISSVDTKDGWFYEKEISQFDRMLKSGLSSNYSSRRVRYISTDETKLRSTELYWLRVRAQDIDFSYSTTLVV